ncbi:hypothetical protein KCM76_22620 [Zooshikella marina]|uniref:hypothetical protein n=1 Tax=Zooshikella ganghwensis TaxID=202772 RepID=UPI001BB0B4DC|nr:hypothetical protein [Zooshikella ganghwensis]MBU2708805.1 hypothetical protein [Zooshikella ganghwensis]
MSATNNNTTMYESRLSSHIQLVEPCTLSNTSKDLKVVYFNGYPILFVNEGSNLSAIFQSQNETGWAKRVIPFESEIASYDVYIGPDNLLYISTSLETGLFSVSQGVDPLNFFILPEEQLNWYTLDNLPTFDQLAFCLKEVEESVNSLFIYAFSSEGQIYSILKQKNNNQLIFYKMVPIGITSTNMCISRFKGKVGCFFSSLSGSKKESNLYWWSAQGGNCFAISLANLDKGEYTFLNCSSRGDNDNSAIVAINNTNGKVYSSIDENTIENYRPKYKINPALSQYVNCKKILGEPGIADGFISTIIKNKVSVLLNNQSETDSVYQFEFDNLNISRQVMALNTDNKTLDVFGVTNTGILYHFFQRSDSVWCKVAVSFKGGQTPICINAFRTMIDISAIDEGQNTFVNVIPTVECRLLINGKIVYTKKDQIVRVPASYGSIAAVIQLTGEGLSCADYIVQHENGSFEIKVAESTLKNINKFFQNNSSKEISTLSGQHKKLFSKCYSEDEVRSLKASLNKITNSYLDCPVTETKNNIDNINKNISRKSPAELFLHSISYIFIPPELRSSSAGTEMERSGRITSIGVGSITNFPLDPIEITEKSINVVLEETLNIKYKITIFSEVSALFSRVVESIFASLGETIEFIYNRLKDLDDFIPLGPFFSSIRHFSDVIDTAKYLTSVISTELKEVSVKMADYANEIIDYIKTNLNSIQSFTNPNGTLNEYFDKSKASANSNFLMDNNWFIQIILENQASFHLMNSSNNIPIINFNKISFDSISVGGNTSIYDLITQGNMESLSKIVIDFISGNSNLSIDGDQIYKSLFEARLEIPVLSDLLEWAGIKDSLTFIDLVSFILSYQLIVLNKLPPEEVKGIFGYGQNSFNAVNKKGDNALFALAADIYLTPAITCLTYLVKGTNLAVLSLQLCLNAARALLFYKIFGGWGNIINMLGGWTALSILLVNKALPIERSLLFQKLFLITVACNLITAVSYFIESKCSIKKFSFWLGCSELVNVTSQVIAGSTPTPHATGWCLAISTACKFGLCGAIDGGAFKEFEGSQKDSPLECV